MTETIEWNLWMCTVNKCKNGTATLKIKFTNIKSDDIIGNVV